MRIMIVLLTALLLAGCVAQDPAGELSLERRSAEAYGTPYLFPRLVIEIDFAAGREPSPLAIETLLDVLRETTKKVDIEIIGPSPLPDESRFRDPEANWANRHRDIHDEFFDSMGFEPGKFGAGDAAFVHVLYLNGRIALEDGSVIRGLRTERGISIYPDDIRNASPLERTPAQLLLQTAPEEIERAILIHEFGHLIGLVDAGAPMVTPHSDGTGHSDNPKSVMYGAVDRATDLPMDGDAVIWRFDENDLADIARLHEEAAKRLRGR